MTRGGALIDGFEPGSVIADKGSAADRLVEMVSSRGATAVIPARRNRKIARDIDRDMDEERNQIKLFFNKLKQFRRLLRAMTNYLLTAWASSSSQPSSSGSDSSFITAA
ncbi:hypothetical protein ABZT49_23090 [Methylobacterium sp. EM32]